MCLQKLISHNKPFSKPYQATLAVATFEARSAQLDSSPRRSPTQCSFSTQVELNSHRMPKQALVSNTCSEYEPRRWPTQRISTAATRRHALLKRVYYTSRVISPNSDEITPRGCSRTKPAHRLVEGQNSKLKALLKETKPKIEFTKPPN